MRKITSFFAVLLLVSVSQIFAEFERAYLFNGLGDVGTLSKIYSGEITNDFMNVGMWPNDMKYYDDKLFVLNSGNHNIQVIDEENLTNLGSINVSANSNPWKMAFANEKIFVTNSYGTGIDVIDYQEQNLLTTITLTDALGGSGAIISAGDFVYANKNNLAWNGRSGSMEYNMETIVKIDPITDTIIDELEVGVNISEMLLDNENELHVLCTGNRDDIGGYVKIIDLDNFSIISTINLGSEPQAFEMTEAGKVYVSISGYNPDYTGFGGIMLYDSETNVVINNSANLFYASANSGIMDIALTPNGLLFLPLFSSNELIVLGQTGNLLMTYATGNGPQGVVYIPEETDIEDNYELRITNYELKQNYPNPFNPVTRINYELGGTLATGGITNYELAEIVVHNAKGQQVWTSDPLSLNTNTCNFDGSKLNSGIYYYSLVVDGKKLSTKSMVLVK